MQEWLYLLGGLALLLLGLAVALLRGRSPAVLAFAAYAIGAGSLNAAYAVDSIASRPGVFRAALVLGLLGFWGLFLYFPRRLRRSHVIPALASAGVGLAMGLGYAIATGQAVTLDGSMVVPATDLLLNTLVSGGIIAVALILPLRAGWMEVTRAEARSLGIVAVGLVSASAGTFPELVRVARGEASGMVGLLDAVYVLTPTLLWLGVTRGPHARIARTTIVASVVIYLASLAVGPDVAWAVGQAGAALLLGYAVLRGQIEGLDLKVRFALSRSTVAAVFVAAFFIASEGAQIVFGQRNEWVGLFAAGTLVFAIAPLQRAADRLAERAVPAGGAAPASDVSNGGHVAAYRLAVRAALRDDGRLTPREETHLADLAQTLGVGAGDALRLRREVEAGSALEGRGDA